MQIFCLFHRISVEMIVNVSAINIISISETDYIFLKKATKTLDYVF